MISKSNKREITLNETPKEAVIVYALNDAKFWIDKKNIDIIYY